jgi:hypothetical protein
MASQFADSLRRLRTENANLLKTAQEQERTILELRARLSEERAVNDHLRKGILRPARVKAPKQPKLPKPPKPMKFADPVECKKCVGCGILLPPAYSLSRCTRCATTDGGFTGGSGSRVVRSSRGMS